MEGRFECSELEAIEHKQKSRSEAGLAEKKSMGNSAEDYFAEAVKELMRMVKREMFR